MKSRFVVPCFVLMFLLSLSSFAGTPPFPKLSGAFNITGYKEPSLQNPFTYCFEFTNTGTVLGFPNSGTWSVPSYAPGWFGEWYANGDELVMSGVANQTYFFTWTGRILSSGKISGRYVEFLSNGATDTAGTILGRKLTGSCPLTAASADKTDDPAR
ncbi:MAG TPA: hypothetical protein VMG31_11790 [Verrucomicrobiae bacterium]|nr:hypothetical protein [Verrucomicrobiae bacterium]